MEQALAPADPVGPHLLNARLFRIGRRFHDRGGLRGARLRADAADWPALGVLGNEPLHALQAVPRIRLLTTVILVALAALVLWLFTNPKHAAGLDDADDD